MQAAVEDGRPLVHQMLMGQGKTTVVTPLTILVHGTSARACVVCCPSALLEFTCKVLRERLCGVLFRPVVEFHFTRSTPVSDDHFFKLLHAQASRAVLCSGPTALKSLLLRFVLTLHAIDVAQSKEVERHEVDRSQGFLGSSVKNLLSWPRWSARNAAVERLEALRFEASALRWALGVFRGAVLLLDDIDLLMHPLRSELHWPLGDQHKLDFTTAASGAREPAETSGELGQDSAVSFTPSGPQEELSQYKVVVQSFGLPLANTLGHPSAIRQMPIPPAGSDLHFVTFASAAACFPNWMESDSFYMLGLRFSA
ncbi:unnamed protein product [Symbiodinium natans]|uniref:DUF3638 domain-containing protein n=1 Tax=Symbiodinium natans TaxID=878477 RepID=A0A812UK88_9DINO|nr:unnamed protein product [Symbiodinium natans]